MNLHEYQAKQLFARFDLPTSRGKVAFTPDEAVAGAQQLGGDRWVAKVQVHAGGRGKAGGVKLISSLTDIRTFAEDWLSHRIKTVQTDANGQPVSCIYIEEIADIENEIYLGAVVDRSRQRVVVIASREGGVEIEEVAAQTPELIVRETIDPALDAQDYQGRRLAFDLGLAESQVAEFTRVFKNLVRLFLECDCSLVEINPLIVTRSGDILCLDAKVAIDNNAAFRQHELVAWKDESQDDPLETQASKFALNYVALDGNIGCMVNGAGLAMGTMDLVKLYGGEPANFLDVGGGVNTDSVREAFKIILADDGVRVVLINIFGGIVSCEIIAKGIIEAVAEVGVDVPVIVRFDGNSASEGSRLLADSDLNIRSVESLREAAKSAVAAARAAT